MEPRWSWSLTSREAMYSETSVTQEVLQLCLASWLLAAWAYHLVLSKVPGPNQGEQPGFSLGLLQDASGCIGNGGSAHWITLMPLRPLRDDLFFPNRDIKNKNGVLTLLFGSWELLLWNHQDTGLQWCICWARRLMKQCGVYNGEASMRSMKNGYGKGDEFEEALR